METPLRVPPGTAGVGVIETVITVRPVRAVRTGVSNPSWVTALVMSVLPAW